MRCNNRRSEFHNPPHKARATLLILASLAGLGWLSAPSAEPKLLTIYAAQNQFSVPISDRDGKDYIDLQAVLEKFGPVSTTTDGHKFKLRFRRAEAQFAPGSGEVRMGRVSLALSSPFYLDNGRALVPLRTLPDLLGRLLDTRVDYQEPSRRLLIGITAIRFSADLKHGQPSSLVLSFSAPVSPQISAESGQLKLIFTRQALANSSQYWPFDDPLIVSATYSETPSQQEMHVTGTEPLLANFSDGGRTITISAAPKLTPATAPSPPSSPPSPSPPTAAPIPPSSSPVPPLAAAASGSAAASPVAGVSAPPQHILVLLDAGHGGDERGAALSEKIAEKDVTLAIARRLRAELQNRGLATFMLRDGDITISLDRRAETANAMRARLYLALHAGSLGRGLRIYTSMLPSPSSGSRPSLAFIPWETAQAGYASASRELASALVDELGKNPFRIPVGLMPAPVRPLNNIAGAALAVEVSPLREDVASLDDPDYQQSIAVALATAISAMRRQLEQSR